MRIAVPAAIALLLSLAIAGNAPAQGYRAEIETQVIDRCYRTTARWRLHLARRTHDISSISEEEIVRVLRDAPHTEPLIAALTKTVSGKSREARQALYDIAYVECFLEGAGS